MSDGMLLQIRDDGTAELYDDTYDITIHCTSQEEQDATRVLLKRAGAIPHWVSQDDIPRWIPCSERMPEEHEWIGTKEFGTTISDEVYVTFENEKGERFCRHMSFQNGELSRHDQFHIDTWFKGSKPIAWMPMPKPYKEDRK